MILRDDRVRSSSEEGIIGILKNPKYFIEGFEYFLDIIRTYFSLETFSQKFNSSISNPGQILKILEPKEQIKTSEKQGIFIEKEEKNQEKRNLIFNFNLDVDLDRFYRVIKKLGQILDSSSFKGLIPSLILKVSH